MVFTPVRIEGSRWSGRWRRACRVGPVDTALEALAQFDLDDLGLQHDLALDGNARGLEPGFDVAKLVGHGAHGHRAGLRADDDAAPGASPTRLRRAVAVSAQKSLVLLVVSWLLSLRRHAALPGVPEPGVALLVWAPSPS